MLSVDHARDLKARAGAEIGMSDWVTITQGMIDAFAHLTGDDHWIHVDTARAEREMPNGRTIAHGLLVLSFIPKLQREIYEVRQRGRGLNYGFDRVRFVSPVPVGSRIRLRQTLIDAAAHKMGTRLEIEGQIEVDGIEKPAVIARNILLVEDA